MNIYLTWALWFLAAEGILFLLQLPFRRIIKKSYVFIILGVVKLILGIAFGFLTMGGPIQLRPVQPLMSALYVALLGDGVADVIFAIFQRAVRVKRLLARKVISLVLGIALLCFGTINMQNVTRTEVSYSSEKLSSDYSFVFVSDMHVGSAQEFKTVEKAIDNMLSEDVDFIVLCGDITDDYTTKEEMEKTFSLFKASDKPVYYVYGNHDRQENAEYANGRQYTVEELEKTLSDNGIRVLKDDFVTIGEDLVILGRSDLSDKEGRKAAEDLNNPDGNAYLVTFDHQPTDKASIKAVQADLQVSGHTHAGQFFPLRAFDNWFYGPAYGKYTIEGTELFVSSGASGWRVPFRSDSKCEYLVVELEANKK